MKIFFIGTVAFSKKTLERLVKNGANIVGVAGKDSSFFHDDYADLSGLCKRHNILYKSVEDINAPDTINWVKSLEPDIIFCFGWSSLLGQRLLHLPPMGVVGYHPAALPKNRGRHPLIWALVLGLEQTASTFFFMEKGVDSGDILSQEPIDISWNDNAKSLYKKMIDTALKQIDGFVPQLEQGTYSSRPQNADEANIWRKRKSEDGKIDFRMTSEAIYNLVRGLTHPYAGAHAEYNGTNNKVWEVEVIENQQNNIEPGKVLDVQDKQPVIKTYDGAIKIKNHEFSALPSVGEYL